MNEKLTIPLFWKFTIALVIIVSTFAVINFYFIKYALYDLFQDQLINHGQITAKSIADRSIDLILYDDIASLDRIVTDQKMIDTTIAYIFILDNKGKLIAKTFEHAVPNSLIKVNASPSPQNAVSIIKIIDEKGEDFSIRDIVTPILDGNLGVVRVGLYERSYINNMQITLRIFLLMVILFLFLGIIGAFFFSYIITTPIKRISRIAKETELDNLNIQLIDFQRSSFKHHTLIKLKNILNVKDEIDELVFRFGDMVSRLKTTYIELQKTQESLSQSEKMAALGTLSAGIAHEINNPIAGIKNCIRRIVKAPENTKQNTLYLSMMSEAIAKIEDVVGGLLNYSRLQKMTFQEVRIEDVIEDVLSLAAYELESAKIKVEKHFPETMPPLWGSMNHLEQVILNILLNAIDAINEKKQEYPDFNGVIRFFVRLIDQTLEISVEDNGIGIPEENLKTIFDPFYTMKKIRQGTGLGLAVCYNIVKQHFGKIKASCAETAGMCFTVSLPIHRNDMQKS